MKMILIQNHLSKSLLLLLCLYDLQHVCEIKERKRERMRIERKMMKEGTVRKMRDEKKERRKKKGEKDLIKIYFNFHLLFLSL